MKTTADDINDFGKRWSKALTDIETSSTDKIDELEHNIENQMQRLVDNSFQALTQQLNESIVNQIRQVERDMKKIMPLEMKFERLERISK